MPKMSNKQRVKKKVKSVKAKKGAKRNLPKPKQIK